MKHKKKKNSLPLYILLTVFAVLFIVVGSKMARKNAVMFTGQTGERLNTYVVRVDLVLDTKENENHFGGDFVITETTIEYAATVMLGGHKGESFVAYQSYDDYTSRIPTPVRAGDWVVVYEQEHGEHQYTSGDIVRINEILIVSAIFFILLVVFGKLKGVATVVALGFSVLSIFLVFIGYF